MTFGKVIESIHLCKYLNPWLIIGIVGCIAIAWILNKVDHKWLPEEMFLFGIAFGMTVKGVWNINFDIAIGILGAEITVLISVFLESRLL